MTAPIFTIIIPTFNCAGTIAACLESILKQTFKDFEILLQDGGSTDETLQVAAAIQSKDSFIHIVTEKDSGIYDAMNRAISRAQGTWLYFLGSDDRLYDTQVLQDIYAEIIKMPQFEVVYGNVWSERFNGTYDGAFDKNKILQKNISHQAILFNKSVFATTGLFDSTYKAQADWDHNLKWILSPTIKSLFVDRIIAYYADGGFSSLNGDDTFYRDLRLNYLYYGRQTLPAEKKIFLYAYEFLKLIKRGDAPRISRWWKLLAGKTK